MGSSFNEAFKESMIIMYLSTDIYLNGKQIIIKDEIFELKKYLIQSFIHYEKSNNFFEKEIKELIKIKLGDLIPKDTIMLKISKFNYNINLFSQELFLQNKNKPKLDNFFNDFKILEKNESFSIIEYPQIKENNYYSIILIGNTYKNYDFICGFINFLFDINYEDTYRLKLESSENKDELFRSFFIKSNKGNFKFNCFNINNHKNITTKIIEEILDTLNKDKINLLVINIRSINYFDFCDTKELKYIDFFIFNIMNYDNNYLKYKEGISFIDNIMNYNNCLKYEEDISFIDNIMNYNNCLKYKEDIFFIDNNLILKKFLKIIIMKKN